MSDAQELRRKQMSEFTIPKVLLLLTVLLFVLKFTFLPGITLLLVFAPIWLPLAITLAFLAIFAGAALLALGAIVIGVALANIEPKKR
jgi:hypothetical protein